MTIEDYARYFDRAEFDLLDMAEWAKAAKQAGMKYAVMGVKHHEGFCLWDTAHTDYKSTNAPCGRDLMREFVDAFRAVGMKVGFYYSLLDWHHPHYTIDRMHPQSPRSKDPAEFARLNEGRDMRIYAQYMRDQVEELLTNYGEISVAWFDFSFVDKWREEDFVWHDAPHGPGPGKGADDWQARQLLELVRKHQPGILLNDRLGLDGAGDIVTPEQYQPEAALVDDQGRPLVWEACHTFSGSWGYHRDESSWKSIDQLLAMLIDGVAKGGNLLLNVGPNGRGALDPRALERLAGMGEWMALHSRSIYSCVAAPDGLVAPADCRFTYNPQRKALYLHLLAWPFGKVVLDGLAGKIRYAQLLNDGSEILYIEQATIHAGDNMVNALRDGQVELKLPTVKPPVSVPVIELIVDL
jgi:alpha-L-fucosidase